MFLWVGHLLAPLQWSMIHSSGFSCCLKIHIVLPLRRLTVYAALLTVSPAGEQSPGITISPPIPCYLPIAGTPTGLVPASVPAWGVWVGACSRQSVSSEPYPTTLPDFANPNTCMTAATEKALVTAKASQLARQEKQT